MSDRVGGRLFQSVERGFSGKRVRGLTARQTLNWIIRQIVFGSEKADDESNSLEMYDEDQRERKHRLGFEIIINSIVARRAGRNTAVIPVQAAATGAKRNQKESDKQSKFFQMHQPSIPLFERMKNYILSNVCECSKREKKLCSNFIICPLLF